MFRRCCRGSRWRLTEYSRWQCTSEAPHCLFGGNRDVPRLKWHGHARERNRLWRLKNDRALASRLCLARRCWRKGKPSFANSSAATKCRAKRWRSSWNSTRFAQLLRYSYGTALTTGSNPCSKRPPRLELVGPLPNNPRQPNKRTSLCRQISRHSRLRCI